MTQNEMTRPRNSTTSKPSQWFVDWVRGPENDSGVAVTPSTALTDPHVWQATCIISGDVAGLPLNVFRRSGDDTRTIDRNHPAWWLLNGDASPYMSARIFRESITSHALLWGNGYALIARRPDGSPAGMSLLLPDRTHPVVRDGRLRYETILNDRTPKEYDAVDIFHLRGLGFDGIVGHSVISQAKNSIGLGMSLRQHGNLHFKNGAYPGVILTSPRRLDKPEAEQIMEGWNASHGKRRRGSTAILHGGLSATVLPIANTDAQWLESRKFQAKEVAAWFNLPPHKLGDDTRVSYNSLETEERSYLTTSLKHWIDRWEDECERKLLADYERRSGELYCEHNLDERLRPDSLQRFQGYELAIANLWLSPNEVRRRENLPPREGGDRYVNPNTTSPDSTSARSTAEAAHRRLLATSVGKLLAIEVSRIRSLAAKGEAFVQAVSDFYANENFGQTWSRELTPILSAIATIIPVHATAEVAYGKHVAESMRRVIDVAGNSYPESLVANIASILDSWSTRLDAVVLDLLGE